MSSTARPNGQTQPTSSDPSAQNPLLPQNQNTYFNQQRALLVNEIAVALETTLTHLNHLNRSLESVIAVGNEFSSVEALWSQVEGVMGNNNNKKEDGDGGDGDGHAGEEEEDMGEEPGRRV